MMNQFLRGGAAGALATGPMTLVIAAARAIGHVETLPPRQITENLGDVVGINSKNVSTGSRNASFLVAHFGYGLACGMLYTFSRPLLPVQRSAAGLLFGGTVWGVSYLGVMPALRLYPWPRKDSGSRMATMIAAHAVFGIALAELEHWLWEMDPSGRDLRLPWMSHHHDSGPQK